MWVKLLLAIVIASAGATGAWKVQENRYEVQLSELRLKHAEEKTAAVTQAKEELSADLKRIQESEAAAVAEAQRKTVIIDRARAESDSLRDELDTLREGIPDLTRVAVNQRAAALTDVFGECVREYQKLAEKADRHVTDLRKLMAAWPGE